jgi:tRNA threonylcarbamoyladenosine dehydratase
MDADLQRRFGGLDRLYGLSGAAAIRAAHVCVIGIGGVGSWAAEALARSGVGRISLVDLDQVAESNINRQIQADSGTVGMAKVDAMAQRIAQINPHCEVTTLEAFAENENWPEIAAANFSAVLDCCDSQKAKTMLAAWALANTRRLKKAAPLFIGVGAAGGKRRADKVQIADLSETTHDPLLSDLRYRLRKQHGAARDKKIGITCVYSQEAVAPPDPSCTIDQGLGRAVAASDNSLNCHGYGSVVSVTATFGMCAAGWVLDQLAASAALKNPSNS